MSDSDNSSQYQDDLAEHLRAAGIDPDDYNTQLGGIVGDGSKGGDLDTHLQRAGIDPEEYKRQFGALLTNQDSDARGTGEIEHESPFTPPQDQDLLAGKVRPDLTAAEPVGATPIAESQSKQNYWNDGSHLVDLGNGRSGIQDADNTVHYIHQPQTYENTRDTTEAALGEHAARAYQDKLARALTDEGVPEHVSNRAANRAVEEAERKMREPKLDMRVPRREIPEDLRRDVLRGGVPRDRGNLFGAGPVMDYDPDQMRRGGAVIEQPGRALQRTGDNVDTSGMTSPPPPPEENPWKRRARAAFQGVDGAFGGVPSSLINSARYDNEWDPKKVKETKEENRKNDEENARAAEEHPTISGGARLATEAGMALATGGESAGAAVGGREAEGLAIKRALEKSAADKAANYLESGLPKKKYLEERISDFANKKGLENSWTNVGDRHLNEDRLIQEARARQAEMHGGRAWEEASPYDHTYMVKTHPDVSKLREEPTNAGGRQPAERKLDKLDQGGGSQSYQDRVAAALNLMGSPDEDARERNDLFTRPSHNSGGVPLADPNAQDEMHLPNNPGARLNVPRRDTKSDFLPPPRENPDITQTDIDDAKRRAQQGGGTLLGQGQTVTPEEKHDVGTGKPAIVGGEGAELPPVTTSMGGRNLAQQPQVVDIPAHEVPLTDPQRQEGIALSGYRASHAMQDEASAEAEGATAEGNALDKLSGDYERMAQKSEQQEAARQKILDNFQQRLQKQTAEIGNEKVDPTHYWKSADAGQVAFNAIALIAGGFVSGIRGGPNYAALEIDKAIDRDIDAQKEDINSKKNAVASAHNQLAEYRLQFGDMRTAEAATRLDRINSMKAYLDGVVAKSKDPAIRARGAALSAQFDMKTQVLLAQLNKWVPDQKVMVGGLGAEAPLEKYVPEVGGIALTKEDADELRKIGPAFQGEQQLLQEALRIRAKGTPTPGSQEALQLQSIAAKLQPIMQQTHGFKRLSGEDAKINDVAMGDPMAIFMSARADQVLRDLIRTSDQQRRNIYRAKGLAAGQLGYDPVTRQRKAYYKGYDLADEQPQQQGNTGFQGL